MPCEKGLLEKEHFRNSIKVATVLVTLVINKLHYFNNPLLNTSDNQNSIPWQNTGFERPSPLKHIKLTYSTSTKLVRQDWERL